MPLRYVLAGLDGSGTWTASRKAPAASFIPVATGWRLAQADAPPPPSPPPSDGPTLPQDPVSTGDRDPRRYRSFGSQVGAVKWELAGIVGYMTAINAAKIAREGGQSFHFQNEGWFGKSTFNLGVDKLAHTFNTYVIADIIGARIRRKTGVEAGTALTGAVLASGLMIYSELFDGVKETSGFSFQDVVANTAGAAFSVFRNTVPGVKEKLDFRLLIIPNSNVYTFTGQRHYRQARYLLALQAAGFDRLKDSPLRFVELHVGYSASGFTARERGRGALPRRKPFVGVGLNLQELLFRSPSSKVGQLAREGLDYIQVPYTYVHVD